MPQLGLLYVLVYTPMNILSDSNTPLESMCASTTTFGPGLLQATPAPRRSLARRTEIPARRCLRRARSLHLPCSLHRGERGHYSLARRSMNHNFATASSAELASANFSGSLLSAVQIVFSIHSCLKRSPQASMRSGRFGQ